MLYVGIDPGAHGGIAAIREDGSPFLVAPLPSHVGDMLTRLRSLEDIKCSILLEQVSGYIGEAHPGSSMFEFGRCYGAIEMGLAAIGALHQSEADLIADSLLVGKSIWDHILPQRWQKGLGLKRAKGMKDTEWKNALKDVAKSHYPRIKITKATSDAVLIARYCKLKHEGKVE